MVGGDERTADASRVAFVIAAGAAAPAGSKSSHPPTLNGSNCARCIVDDNLQATSFGRRLCNPRELAIAASQAQHAEGCMDIGGSNRLRDQGAHLLVAQARPGKGRSVPKSTEKFNMPRLYTTTCGGPAVTRTSELSGSAQKPKHCGRRSSWPQRR